MSKSGQGMSKRNMRLKLARELMEDRQQTEDQEKRLELARLIKGLTDGRKIKPKARRSVFDSGSER